jgi:hypothetical protein
MELKLLFSMGKKKKNSFMFWQSQSKKTLSFVGGGNLTVKKILDEVLAIPKAQTFLALLVGFHSSKNS